MRSPQLNKVFPNTFVTNNPINEYDILGLIDWHIADNASFSLNIPLGEHSRNVPFMAGPFPAEWDYKFSASISIKGSGEKICCEEGTYKGEYHYKTEIEGVLKSNFEAGIIALFPK